VSVALYIDEHVHRAITGLRLRSVDLLTAQEDGRRKTPDDVLLDRATELRYVVFSQDEDLLAEATRRQDKAFRLQVSSMPINCTSRLAHVCTTWN
jgi:rRNA-processing protein FCF1